MWKYMLKRSLSMVITLWLIATLTFVIMHLIPGDPFATEARMLPEEVVRNMRERYHLDKPLIEQYVQYMNGLIHLDLGPSIQQKSQDVTTLIQSGFPASAVLGLQSLVIALAGGIALGVVAALFHNRLMDYAAGSAKARRSGWSARAAAASRRSAGP